MSAVRTHFDDWNTHCVCVVIQIGDVGVTKLSAALKNMHSLTALNLDGTRVL